MTELALVYISFKFQGGGWVHSVSFSADGNKLAWVSHDSSVSVANATNEMVVHKLTTKFLPFLSCIWISPNTILAAGHGCEPLLFHHDEIGGEITFVNKLDQSKAAETTTKFSARELFASRDTKGIFQNLNLPKAIWIKTQHTKLFNQNENGNICHI